MADGAGDDVVTIVANLVDNALEACGPGGLVELLVEHRAGADVLVRVSDDGPGVPTGSRERIFQLGVSTKSSESDPDHGRGIGLALVGRIVTRRGGSVTVESRPREAARCSRRCCLQPALGRGGRHRRGGPMTDERIRVLVVDDDFAVADVHVPTSRTLGISVVAVAHTGAQALQAVEDRRPDLVLLDLHLPTCRPGGAAPARPRPDGADLDILAITAAREVETMVRR